MQNEPNNAMLDKHLVRVTFKGQKPKYVGSRINKGVCLTDYKAAYHLSFKEANDIVNELKNYKEYNQSTTTIDVVSYGFVTRFELNRR